MSGKHKAVILLSGGVDSTVALYHAARQYEVVLAVSFDYSSKHNAKEIPCAALQSATLGVPHSIVDLTAISKHLQSDLLLSGGDIPDGEYDSDNMAQTVVPFRNGIMLSVAAGIAESLRAQALIIAAHSGDHALYPDCSSEFTEKMSLAIEAGTYDRIQVIAPFVHINKSDIVRIGADLGVDFSKTWSCYKGGDIHCGRCGTCIERRESFLEAQIPDPTIYSNQG